MTPKLTEKTEFSNVTAVIPTGRVALELHVPPPYIIFSCDSRVTNITIIKVKKEKQFPAIY